MTDAKVETIESDKDALAAGTSDAELWLKKIERAKKEEEDWRKEACEAIKAYEADDKEAQQAAFNIFHSNVETLIPALYNSTPVPDVRRRFGDSDPLGKQVVDLSERAISYTLDQFDFDAEMVAIIRDAAVTGRGIGRIRYHAKMGADGGYQEVSLERVPWDKYIRGPARSWSKIPWETYEHDLTKDQLEKLNPSKAKKLSIGEAGDKSSKDESSKDPSGIFKTRRVYEIWDKARRRVAFIDDQKEIWKDWAEDPLQLEGFFPSLQPLQPVHRASSLVPVCQYKVYKPLFDELDVVTKRISKLVKQLKVRGLIDSESAADFELLKSCEDGQYVPAQNGSTFASQGGLEKAIAHWPMDPTVKALQQLYMQRDSLIQRIYEATGISDILRGQSNPNETATAQNIKNQWGSLRVQRLQNEVARLSRDFFRAMVEVFAKHFTPQNLSLMTGLPASADEQVQQVWPKVIELFKSDLRSFRIDIETDSTVRADMTRNQEQMNSFLAGTAQFVQGMVGLIELPQVGQAALPVITEVYTAFARKFKLGKQAEDALDKLSTQVQQLMQQPQQEKPDPEMQKAELQMKTMEQKAQLDAQGLQAKAQHEERMAQLAEQKAAMEIEIKQLELVMKREEMALNMQAKQQEHAMKAQSMALDARAQQEQRQMDSQERAEDFAYSQAERRENADLMHEKNEAQRQGMADKQKFQKQQMKAKQETRPSA